MLTIRCKKTMQTSSELPTAQRGKEILDDSWDSWCSCCGVSLPDVIWCTWKLKQLIHKSISCQTLSWIQRRIWQNWLKSIFPTAPLMPYQLMPPRPPQIVQDIWKLQLLVTVARVETMSQCPGCWECEVQQTWTTWDKQRREKHCKINLGVGDFKYSCMILYFHPRS